MADKTEEPALAYARKIRVLEAARLKALNDVEAARDELKEAKEAFAEADAALHQFIRDDTAPLFS